MNNEFNTPSTVLFVDDEEKARKYFSLAMTSDFEVLTAGSAAEALKILTEHANQIAIIVSDQRMPEQSGVEMLKIVKEYYPHIVRLLTTAYTDLDDAIEAINRGEILRYIQKPWDINVLKTELNQAMDYFQLRNERDNLLQEKLSVRQRMVQIERISKLLLIAESLTCLRFSNTAIKQFINLLVADKAAFSKQLELNELPRMDFWDLTLAEAKRMQVVARKLSGTLNEHTVNGQDFTHSLDCTAVRDVLKKIHAKNASSSLLNIVIAEESSDLKIQTNQPLLELLLQNLCSLPDDDINSMQINISGTNSTLKIALELSAQETARFGEILTGASTDEVPTAAVALMTCILIAFHHGGSITLESSGLSSICITLPGDPEQTSIPEKGTEWHENILQLFEPDYE